MNPGRRSAVAGRISRFGEVVKVLVAAVLGATLGFAAALLAIGAAVLLAAGVGAGILVRARPRSACVLNYDPSDVVARAAGVALAALGVCLVFAWVYVALRRQELRMAKEQDGEDTR